MRLRHRRTQYFPGRNCLATPPPARFYGFSSGSSSPPRCPSFCLGLAQPNPAAGAPGAFIGSGSIVLAALLGFVGGLVWMLWRRLAIRPPICFAWPRRSEDGAGLTWRAGPSRFGRCRPSGLFGSWLRCAGPGIRRSGASQRSVGKPTRGTRIRGQVLMSSPGGRFGSLAGDVGTCARP